MSARFNHPRFRPVRFARPMAALMLASVASPALARHRKSSSPPPADTTPAPASALPDNLEPAPLTPAPKTAAPKADAPAAQHLAPSPAAMAAPSKPAVKFTRVMVGTLKRDNDVPEKVARFVGQALVQELRKLEHLQVSSAADIDEMLSFEEQKRLVGCTDEVCLSEIVAAMGVDQLVTGSLSSTAKAHILTLNRLDVAGAKTLATVTKELEKRDGEEFLSAIGPAVETLFAETPLKPGLTRGVAPEVAKRLNPPPLPRWSFFTVLATGAAVAGGGVVAALSSKDAENQYNTLATQALSTSVSGAQLVQLSDTATSRAHLANTLFLAGGGVALAAGVMAFFTDWSPAPAEPTPSLRPTSVSIAPGTSSGAVAATWTLP
jgi:hypothetical protein